MKRAFFAICLLSTFLQAYAVEDSREKSKGPDYQFTTIKENKITSIKNQFRSGTCWSFATTSFIESEMLRKTGANYDLSEMWIVSHSYHDRAIKFVRLDGYLKFSAGSSYGDAFAVVRDYGIVPEEVYTGLKYGYDKPVQAELDAVLKAYVEALVARPGKSSTSTWSLSTAWRKGLDGILQAYMGEWPADFIADGKKYTPITYRDEVLKFNTEDYVNICSFAAEPWYEFCPIEVCDNWRGDKGFNLPMEDLMRVIYNALDNGHTVLWAGDVSEKGCDRNGLGVMPKPAPDVKPAAGSESDAPVSIDIPEEVEVSDSLRQDAYDRKLTTDDHGMHIYGYAQDQNGTRYFLTKNSWGEIGKYKGIWYLSDTFVRFKTLNIIVHKDALPKDIRKKLMK